MSTTPTSATRREAPWPLRIPKEWHPEILANANRDGVKPHAYLVKAVRRVLDADRAAHTRRLKRVSAIASRSMPSPEKCRHPITRRIGTGCGACGKDPV